MIKIYLCDDDPIWLKRIEHAIISYQVSSDWELSINYRASSPSELLCYLKDNPPISGIYFLDVEYKTSMNGIELGLEIRKLDTNAFLIFISSHGEMVLETFRLKVMALDYIIKDRPDLNKQIHSCLDYIEKKYITQTQNSSFLRIQVGTSRRFLFIKEIYYISSQKGCHKISIHTKHAVLSISCTISELKRELGDSFILCNRGCLVNVSHIVSADRSNKTLILDNGEICYCSIRLWRQLSNFLDSILKL